MVYTTTRISTSYFSLVWILAAFLSACSMDRTPASSSADSVNSKEVVRMTATPEKEPSHSENTIEPSQITEKLEKFMSDNPKATLSEVADFGNHLLPTEGFDFLIDLEKIVGQVLDSKKAVPSDDNELGYSVSFELGLKTVSAGMKSFNITAPAEPVCCCGFHFTPFPVTSITKDRMTLVVDGRQVEIKRDDLLPADLENVLVKNSKEVRSWQVPYEGKPYGISDDGRNLYIAVGSIEGLLLEINEKGEIKFVANSDKKIVADGIDANKQPPAKIGEIIHRSGEYGLMEYKTLSHTFYVEFPYVCS